MPGNPSKKKLTKINQAQSATVDELSRNLAAFEKRLDAQESKNQNIIIGVLCAALFVFISLVVSIVIYYYSNHDFYISTIDKLNDTGTLFNNKMNEQDIEMIELKNELSNLKARNPYIK